MAPTETNSATMTNKRKRGGGDQGPSRPSPSARNTMAGAEDETGPPQQHYDEGGLSQIIAHNNGSHEASHVTPNGPSTTVAQTAAAALTHYQVPASFESGAPATQEPGMPFSLESAGFTLDQLKDSQQLPHTPQQDTPQSGSGGSKPPVGSEEWHRIRRDNHKEVERRRREAINEGINELSKLVPGCEKNKGSILQRACQYIGQLKENEQQNIEKWTLEKLLLDQAITELSATNDRLKNESNYYKRELEIYKRACEENSIVPPEVKELENEESNEAAEE